MGRPEPAIGVLRLGSATAIADTVGASDDAARISPSSRGAAARAQGPDARRARGARAFVGMGVDAQLLEDNEAIGASSIACPVHDGSSGATRYALSVALRSVPRFATGTRPERRGHQPRCAAREMKRGGATGRQIRAGEVCGRARARSSPARDSIFGFGLKMFAFSMPVRALPLACGDAGLFEILRQNAPAAFRRLLLVHVRLPVRSVRVELDQRPDRGRGRAARRRSKSRSACGSVTLVSWRQSVVTGSSRVTARETSPRQSIHFFVEKCFDRSQPLLSVSTECVLNLKHHTCSQRGRRRRRTRPLPGVAPSAQLRPPSRMVSIRVPLEDLHARDMKGRACAEAAGNTRRPFDVSGWLRHERQLTTDLRRRDLDWLSHLVPRRCARTRASTQGRVRFCAPRLERPVISDTEKR